MKLASGSQSGVAVAQGVLVNGNAKAACLQFGEDAAAGGNVFAAGVFGQYGHFQHDFFRGNQLQVATGQAVMGAVDEDQLFPHQRFGAGVGQGVKEQRGITGRCERGGAAVKQFVAEDLALGVEQGLATNKGGAVQSGGGLGGHGVGGGTHNISANRQKNRACTHRRNCNRVAVAQNVKFGGWRSVSSASLDFDLVAPGQGPQVGPVDLLVGQPQFFGHLVKGVVVVVLAGLGQ